MTAALVLLAACSAPATPPDLSAAEQAERTGDLDGALTAYIRAQASCREVRDVHRRRRHCAQAHLGRAELLVGLGRKDEALAAFRAVPTALPGDPTAQAQALYRVGELELERGELVAAYRDLWRVVTDFPDEAFAGDALDLVVKDGRQRDAVQLERELGRLVVALVDRRIADNLLYQLADLAEARGDLGAARAALDALESRYPKSGLRDDALWHGARLSRALGDGAGAARRLARLVATREVSWGGAGSYFSVWLDDGQLELGRVRRDDLKDPAGAVEAFEQLGEDYPASILIDDALWEIARTHAATGDQPRACKALAKLAKKFPDTRWNLEQAPALARDLGCKPPAP